MWYCLSGSMGSGTASEGALQVSCCSEKMPQLPCQQFPRCLRSQGRKLLLGGLYWSTTNRAALPPLSLSIYLFSLSLSNLKYIWREEKTESLSEGEEHGPNPISGKVIQFSLFHLRVPWEKEFRTPLRMKGVCVCTGLLQSTWDIRDMERNSCP